MISQSTDIDEGDTRSTFPQAPERKSDPSKLLTAFQFEIDKSTDIADKSTDNADESTDTADESTDTADESTDTADESTNNADEDTMKNTNPFADQNLKFKSFLGAKLNTLNYQSMKSGIPIKHSSSHPLGCPSTSTGHFSPISSTDVSQKFKYSHGGATKKLDRDVRRYYMLDGISKHGMTSYTRPLKPSVTRQSQMALFNPSKAHETNYTDVNDETTTGFTKIIENPSATESAKIKSLDDAELYKLRNLNFKDATSDKCSTSLHPIKPLEILPQTALSSLKAPSSQMERNESSHIVENITENTRTSTCHDSTLNVSKTIYSSQSQHSVQQLESRQAIKGNEIYNETSDNANIYPKLKISPGYKWKKSRYFTEIYERETDNFPIRLPIEPPKSLPKQELTSRKEESQNPKSVYDSVLKELKKIFAGLSSTENSLKTVKQQIDILARELDAKHAERVARRKARYLTLIPYNKSILISQTMQPGMQAHHPKFPPTTEIEQREVQFYIPQMQTSYDPRFLTPSVQGPKKEVPAGRQELRRSFNTPSIYSQDTAPEMFSNRQEKIHTSNFMSRRNAPTEIQKTFSNVYPISPETNIRVREFLLKKAQYGTQETLPIYNSRFVPPSEQGKMQDDMFDRQKLGPTSNTRLSSTFSQGDIQEMPCNILKNALRKDSGLSSSIDDQGNNTVFNDSVMRLVRPADENRIPFTSRIARGDIQSNTQQMPLNYSFRQWQTQGDMRDRQSSSTDDQYSSHTNRDASLRSEESTSFPNCLEREIQSVTQQMTPTYEARFSPPSVQGYIQETPLERQVLRLPVNTSAPSASSQEIPQEIYTTLDRERY